MHGMRRAVQADDMMAFKDAAGAEPLLELRQCPPRCCPAPRMDGTHAPPARLLCTEVNATPPLEVTTAIRYPTCSLEQTAKPVKL